MTRRRAPSVAAVVRCLEKAYGKRPWKAGRRPLDSLIGTILSQNTSDHNSGAAMVRLAQAFRDWDEVADAPLRQIAAGVRVRAVVYRPGPGRGPCPGKK